MNYSHIKVLQPQNNTAALFDDYYYYENCEMQEIPPVFNRNGRYYDRKRKLVWEEYNGRAFLERRIDDFVYKLSLLSHRPLLPESVKCIKFLISEKLAPQKIKELYWLDCNWKSLRNSSYEIRLMVNRNLKDFKKEYAQKN